MIGPPVNAVVQGRVDLELSRLSAARSFLTQGGPGFRLLNRLAGDRVTSLLADAQRPLERLSEKAALGIVDSGAIAELVRGQEATDRVLAECLILAIGCTARSAGLDSGACEESDRLIRELAARADRRFARPTVPGAAEELNRAADVIRRRVPDHGIWDLPIIAHEFGHVVTHGLQSYVGVTNEVVRPAKAFLDRYDGARRQQAAELFCDAFATYVIGPAYPSTLILHRLDPTAPAVATADDSHPGPASRVYGCLWILRQMQTSSGTAAFGRSITQLNSAWSQLQAHGPVGARLSETDRLGLVRELEMCWATLQDHLGAFRCEWPAGVPAVVAALQSGVTPRADYSRVDVVNAAWIVRIDSWTRGTPEPQDLMIAATALLRALPDGDGVGDDRG